MHAAAIFTALTYLNLLRFPLMMFPMVINQIVEAKVSIARLNKYLLAEELPEYEPGVDTKVPVRVTRGYFEWPEPPPKAAPKPPPEPGLIARVLCCKKGAAVPPAAAAGFSPTAYAIVPIFPHIHVRSIS